MKRTILNNRVEILYTAILVGLVVIITMTFFTIREHKYNNYISSVMKDSLKLKESFIKYYITQTLEDNVVIKQEIESIKLLNEKNEQLDLNDVSNSKSFIIYFPTNVCPTCYNMVAFKEMATNAAFNLVILVPVDQYVNTKWFLNYYNIPIEIFSYMKGSSLVLENLVDPFVFLWENNSLKSGSLLFFPKQVYSDLVTYYIKLVND